MNKIFILSVLLIIFLLSPILSLTFVLLINFIKIDNLKKLDTINIYLLMVALFLAALNKMRIISYGDLVNYSSLYKNLNYFSFQSFIDFVGKEPVFYAYEFTFKYLTGGDFSSFLFFNTFLSYLLVFRAIINFFSGQPFKFRLITIGIIALFFELFSIGGQLIRQFLASALTLYILSERKSNYKVIVLALLSVFIHSSTFFVLPVVIIKYYNSKFNLSLNNPILIGVFIFILTLFFTFILSIVNLKIGFIANPLNRFINMRFNDQNNFGGLGYIFLYFSVIVFLFLLIKVKRMNNEWMYFLSIFFVILLISISTKNLISLLSYRYVFFTYLYTPILLVELIYIYVRNNLFQNLIFILIISLLLLRFFAKFNYGIISFEHNLFYLLLRGPLFYY